MLILSRRQTESIYLGDDIRLTIVSVGQDKVRIGVKAPPGVRILRNELEVRPQTIPFPGADPAPPNGARTTTDSVAQDPQLERPAPLADIVRRAA